jgi:hypothetical protein
MRTAKKLDPEHKQVKAAKKPADFEILPSNTTIEVVAIIPDGTAYIFDLTIADWRNIKKKPGVQYLSFQKGFSQFKEAIRTDYFKQQ